MTFISLTISPRNPKLWTILPVSLISALLGNFSAWQQPFWERISKGHHTDILNFELEYTHTKTHIYIHILKCRRADTVWLMPVSLCISYQTHTVSMSVRDTGEAEAVSVKSNYPHLDLSTLMSVAHQTHSHTPTLIPSPHNKTVPQSHTHPAVCEMLQWVCVCAIQSTSHYCHCATHKHTHKATELNLVMLSCN